MIDFDRHSAECLMNEFRQKLLAVNQDLDNDELSKTVTELERIVLAATELQNSRKSLNLAYYQLSIVGFPYQVREDHYARMSEDDFLRGEPLDSKVAVGLLLNVAEHFGASDEISAARIVSDYLERIGVYPEEVLE